MGANSSDANKLLGLGRGRGRGRGRGLAFVKQQTNDAGPVVATDFYFGTPDAVTTVVISDNTTGRDFTGFIATFAKENAPTTNQSTQPDFESTSFGVGDRGHGHLLPTGLSNIPAGSTITAVTIELYQDNSAGVNHLVDLNRSLTSVTQSQMTWNERATATNWSSNGGLNATDVTLTADAQQTMVVGGSGYKAWTSAALVDYVQQVVNGTISNYGWLVPYNPDTIYDSSFTIFRSDNGTDGQRPKITVTYTTNPVVTHAITGALTSGESIVNASFNHATLHNITSSLTGGSASVNASFNHLILHNLSASLGTTGAAINASLARTRLHDIAASLTADYSLINASLARSTGTVSHDITATVTAQSAIINASVNRTRAHDIASVLGTNSAIVTGALNRTRLHALTVVLRADGSSVNAGLNRTRQHALTSTLSTQGAYVAANFNHAVPHSISSLLNNGGASVIAALSRSGATVNHAISANLVAGAASVIVSLSNQATRAGGRASKRQHRFIVEKDGVLTTYYNKQDAINALKKSDLIDVVDTSAPITAEVQPQPVKAPVLYDINAMLLELQDYSRAMALINQKNYEQFIKSYEKWIDEEEIELLLLMG